MIPVFRKELRGYKGQLLGFVFVAFLLAAIGLYFSFNCLNLSSPKYESVFESLQFVFLIFVPILTMRVFAEERKQRTDQLLLTLPLRAGEIVLGKYLALELLYALPLLVSCAYPLILTRFGRINLPAAYASHLGFFLLGSTYLAVGTLCSFLTQTPVISAVLCFGVLLLSYVSGTLEKMFPYTAKGSLWGLLGLLGLLALLLYGSLRRLFVSLALLLAGGGALLAIYQCFPSYLEGAIQRVLHLFYVNDRLEGFYEGILDVKAIFYFVGCIVFLLFLAAQLLAARGAQEKRRHSLGGRSLLEIGILLGLLAVGSGILGRIPSRYTQIDLSTMKLYTLTDTSQTFLEGLSQEVRLSLVCEGGQEDDLIWRLLKLYEEGSPLVSVQKVDPALSPAFASRFTKERVANNSVIVEGREKSQVVFAKEFYTLGTSIRTGRMIETAFLGEGLITSAIDFVTSESLPVFYYLNANGERSLGESFLKATALSNLSLKPLNLLSQGEVPEDAAGVLLLAPQVDYSREQRELLYEYLQGGGSALLLTDFSLEDFPGLTELLAAYGMERAPGIVLEGDSSRYISYPYCLVPELTYFSFTSQVYGRNLLLPMAQGILEAEGHRDSLTLTPFFASSKASYSKADVEGMTTSEMEEGDLPGPFPLGMLCEEDSDRDGKVDTRVMYVSTGYVLDEDYDRTVSGANSLWFGEALRYLCGPWLSKVYVPGRSLQSDLLALTDFEANLWTVVTLFVLPLGVLGLGLVSQLLRRRGRGEKTKGKTEERTEKKAEKKAEKKDEEKKDPPRRRGQGGLRAGGVLLLLLGLVYLFLTRFAVFSPREETSSLGEVAILKAATPVVSLSFPLKEGRTTFEKQEGVWRLLEEEEFPVSQDLLEKLSGEVSDLWASRYLKAGEGDLPDYGFSLEESERRQGAIVVGEEGGEVTSLSLGMRNSSNGQLYVHKEGEEGVYLTRTSLDKDFSGSRKRFAAYEVFPSLVGEKIREICVSRGETCFTLVTPGDDKATVEWEGRAEAANLEKVGQVHSTLCSLSWLENLEYACKDFSPYGLEEPSCRVEIRNEDGTGLCFLVGGEDERGNYYVRLASPTPSSQVHSVRREYLDPLINAVPQDFWSLTYSFVSLGDVEKLTLTYEGRERVFTKSPEGNWLMDGRSVDQEKFKNFYYQCVSLTAQERLLEVPQREDLLLRLDYLLADGTHKEISYYPGDQNLAVVVYGDGTKAGKVNESYLQNILKALRALLEG